jgi:hypothetical protein
MIDGWDHLYLQQILIEQIAAKKKAASVARD